MKLLFENWRKYLNESNSGVVVAIFGPSGCGKSRQKDIFKKHGFKELISLVTRPPRGESDAEYEFTTEEDWLKEYEEGNLVNTNKYGGNYYGIRLDDLLSTDKAVLITDETSIDGSKGKEDLKNVAKKHGKTLILAFCAPPDGEELEKRHLDRLESGEYKNKEEYEERLRKAKEEASNIESKIENIGINFYKLYNDDDSEELALKFAQNGEDLEEDFQDDVKKDHPKEKKRLIATGKRKKEAPFVKNPSLKRSKSSPPGFGGS